MINDSRSRINLSIEQDERSIIKESEESVHLPDDINLVEEVRKNLKDTGRKWSKAWNYISPLKTNMVIDNNKSNLVCKICLHRGKVVGAFHAQGRPSNFFANHHRLEHEKLYKQVLASSNSSKMIVQAIFDGTDYVPAPEDTKPRVIGESKAKLDRVLQRAIVLHNLPTRFVKYEGIRSFLLDLATITNSDSVYIPCARDQIYKHVETDVKEIKKKIKDAIKRATVEYGRIKFLTAMHDGWKNKKNERFIGLTVTWIDLKSFEMQIACLGATCVLGTHDAIAVSNWTLERYEEFEIPIKSIHLALSDGAEKKTTDILSKKTGCYSGVCYDHSLVCAVSYATGKKRYRGPRADNRNNEYAFLVFTQTRKLVKVFAKSSLNTERLQAIQMEYIKEKKPPFLVGINTSLRGDNSTKQTTEPMRLMLDGDTRWTGVGDMLVRTYRHLAACIDQFYRESIDEAMSKPTEKGRKTVLTKAKVGQVTPKVKRECQQIAAWAEKGQYVIRALEQKFNPTLPIGYPAIKWIYERNKKYMSNEKPIDVVDETGELRPIKLKEAESVVQRAAKLFDLEMKERFPELNGVLPQWIAAACVADPRQKGIDLESGDYEQAKAVITNRLEYLMNEEGFCPLRPNQELSSDEDNRYSEWDDDEEIADQSKAEMSREEKNDKSEKVESEKRWVPLTAKEILEQYLAESRLGESASKNINRRAGMLLDFRSDKFNILDWFKDQYRGNWYIKVGNGKVAPSNDEKRVRQLLVTVLCSFTGGHISTALQESTFSMARLAEGGIRATRGQAVNLASRVFVKANQNWLTPIKGTHCRISDLKRKGLSLKIPESQSEKKIKTC